MPTKRLNFELAEADHRRLKALAAEEGVSISALLRVVIADLLVRPEADERRRQLIEQARQRVRG